jgi:hypothetical protein
MSFLFLSSACLQQDHGHETPAFSDIRSAMMMLMLLGGGSIAGDFSRFFSNAVFSQSYLC